MLSQAIYQHFFSCQSAAVPVLPGGSAVVSVVANMHRGFPGMAHTGAARAGVVNLTQSLSVEWAAAGVRVNALAPGVIASSGLDRYDPAMSAAIRASAPRSIYAGRLGTEAECAAAILFLLSPAAAFITGACLNMDGGESVYAPNMPPAHAAQDEEGAGDKQQQPQHNLPWDDPPQEKTAASSAKPIPSKL